MLEELSDSIFCLCIFNFRCLWGQSDLTHCMTLRRSAKKIRIRIVNFAIDTFQISTHSFIIVFHSNVGWYATLVLHTFVGYCLCLLMRTWRVILLNVPSKRHFVAFLNAMGKFTSRFPHADGSCKRC